MRNFDLKFKHPVITCVAAVTLAAVLASAAWADTTLIQIYSRPKALPHIGKNTPTRVVCRYKPFYMRQDYYEIGEQLPYKSSIQDGVRKRNVIISWGDRTYNLDPWPEIKAIRPIGMKSSIDTDELRGFVIPFRPTDRYKLIAEHRARCYTWNVRGDKPMTQLEWRGVDVPTQNLYGYRNRFGAVLEMDTIPPKTPGSYSQTTVSISSQPIRDSTFQIPKGLRRTSELIEIIL